MGKNLTNPVCPDALLSCASVCLQTPSVVFPGQLIPELSLYCTSKHLCSHAAAYAGARHNSIDAACRVAVSAAARDAQVASEWRPLAGARVGSKDIKRSRQAREAMLTVDFHKYM